MSSEDMKESTFALETIVAHAMQIPGIEVNRSRFLSSIFPEKDYDLERIINEGPVAAGIDQETLAKLANKLIFKRTGASSVASFLAGLPGGVALAATIPADVLQFFAMAVRLAQELAYLYGAEDFWKNGEIDNEKVRNQMVLYCGVMFGASGAVSGVRVLTAQIAKTALKKIPQKALTKTFWYPIVKQVAKAIGVKVTKTTVANGISKAIPVIGGVISGSLNFASMYPMAHRLQKSLEDASFDYTDEELAADIEVIENIETEGSAAASEETPQKSQLFDRVKETTWSIAKRGVSAAKGAFNTMGQSISSVFNKKKDSPSEENTQDENRPMMTFDERIEMIRKLKDLLDDGIITQEEFDQKKAQLLEL